MYVRSASAANILPPHARTYWDKGRDALTMILLRAAVDSAALKEPSGVDSLGSAERFHIEIWSLFSIESILSLLAFTGSVAVCP